MYNFDKIAKQITKSQNQQCKQEKFNMLCGGSSKDIITQKEEIIKGKT